MQDRQAIIRWILRCRICALSEMAPARYKSIRKLYSKYIPSHPARLDLFRCSLEEQRACDGRPAADVMRMACRM